MSCQFNIDWGQVTLWPVLWCGCAKCPCCNEDVYAIGITFGPLNFAVQFGG